MFHMDGGSRMFGKETSKPTNTWATIKRFGTYFRPFWPALLLMLVLAISSTYVQVLTPEQILQVANKYLVDDHLTEAVLDPQAINNQTAVNHGGSHHAH